LAPGEAVAAWPLAVVVWAAPLVVAAALVAAGVVLAAVLVVALDAAPVVALAGALLDVLVVVLVALAVVVAGALLVVLATADVEPLLLTVAVALPPHAVKRIAPSSNIPGHQCRPIVPSQITRHPPPLLVRLEII
jgi:hypothetical protein